MASAQVCPVVGTTNNVLPPSHPEVDLQKPGQVCPKTNASTDHHKEAGLVQHPPVEIPASAKPTDASACPALKNIVKTDPVAQEVDEKVCPVVGTATTVLPPDHPSVADKEGKECPVTKATVGHHKGVLHEHPNVSNAPSGATCPVVGAKA